MKKVLLTSALCLGLMASQATVHVVSVVSGPAFSPSTITANVGDTVAWVLTSIHTATEVSSSTWAANGNTPLTGGFNFNASSTAGGTSWIQVTTPGTRYFVCSPHASMGMKGQINVSATTGIEEQTQTVAFNLYPNPATEFVNLNVSGADNEMVTIDVVNLLGSKVLDLGGKQNLVNGVKKIDISALPKGIYFLNIVADNKNRSSVRFVKQ